MQIWAKSLTGKTINLRCGDDDVVQIGPRREDGSFRLRIEAVGIDMFVTTASVGA